MKKTQLTVIDFFSGAGGFSEGFRQQGFKVVKGVDYWEPAVRTHNLNHGLEDVPENVLDYMGSSSSDVERIEALPDADVIIGSPSCVTFSMSNKSGKADKTEGLKLIEAYLRVIAVKKHKEGGQLKAWLMENVPNSGNYVKHEYTFKDLNLELWATAESLDPNAVALTLNGVVLNASDYGAPQHRSRFICGETIADGKFPLPERLSKRELPLLEIKSKMPKPNAKEPKGLWQDPNYPGLKLKASQISDHFYDTGLYITQWEQARYLKTMHPFMGKMSFPEDESRPSRTITATRSSTTREALIYQSEYQRTGHGEYRSPTIREAATLMGYPYTYQFFGSESLKWKLIGNSVSPQLSRSLAKAILLKEGRKPVSIQSVDFEGKQDLHLCINNLNTFSPGEFADKKIRKSGARFRRSLYKGQNITVDLLNYRPGRDDIAGKKWFVAVFYGTGSDHKYNFLDQASYRRLNKILKSDYGLFEEFTSELEGVADNQLTPQILQDTYENDSELSDRRNPLVIAGHVQSLCSKYAGTQPESRLAFEGMERPDFSLIQLLYMFTLTHIVYNSLQRESAVGEASLNYEYKMA